MGYEVRLEVNIDVIKKDIDIETVKNIVIQCLQAKLPQYVELQSVLVVLPK